MRLLISKALKISKLKTVVRELEYNSTIQWYEVASVMAYLFVFVGLIAVAFMFINIMTTEGYHGRYNIFNDLRPKTTAIGEKIPGKKPQDDCKIKQGVCDGSR